MHWTCHRIAHMLFPHCDVDHGFFRQGRVVGLTRWDRCMRRAKQQLIDLFSCHLCKHAPADTITHRQTWQSNFTRCHQTISDIMHAISLNVIKPSGIIRHHDQTPDIIKHHQKYVPSIVMYHRMSSGIMERCQWIKEWTFKKCTFGQKKFSKIGVVPKDCKQNIETHSPAVSVRAFVLQPACPGALEGVAA